MRLNVFSPTVQWTAGDYYCCCYTHQYIGALSFKETLEECYEDGKMNELIHPS